ncbi:MAG TPA: PAS domain S-box protein [Holophaga sp.]|nr:PAS domain S-box protein [Holophaga sp.]
MIAPLKLLIIEDSQADFQLTARNLRQHGIEGELHRVDDPASLEAALAAGGWDAVISDYNVPSLDFHQTLALLRSRLPQAPVILLSGSIGEETALELLRNGLTDFVLKDRPTRLAGALLHALEGARHARESRSLSAALLESEARFSTLFNLSPLGMGLSEWESGRMVEANEALLAIFGQTREQLIGRTSLEAGHFVDPADRQALGERLRAEGRVHDWSCRARRASGEAFDLLVSAARVKLAGQDYMLGIVSDITATKEAERALQASELRYRSLFENLEEGIAHCRLLYEDGRAADFEYIATNPAFHRVTSLGPVVGRRVTEVVAGIRQDNPELFPFYEAVVRTGIPARTEVYIPVLAQWFAITAHRHAGDEFIAMVENITDRKIAELNLRSSRARFRKIFQVSPVAIVLSRLRDAIILEANPAFLRLFELEAEEVTGRRSVDLGLWPDPALREEVLASLRRDGRFRADIQALRTHKGREVFVTWTTDLVDLDGESILLTLLQDQTARVRAEVERRRLEAEVGHAQKLDSLGALAGGISHDMNNVLATIMAIGSLVQAQHRGDPELARNMGMLMRAAERGRDLVKGLRDFVRKDVAESRLLDLNDLVRQEAALLSRTTLQRVRVETSLAEGLPGVMGDPSAIGNVLMNLCVNALDAMPQGGRLELGTRPGPGGGVEVTVRDTGHGMTPEVRDRALEPFFTTKPSGKGTGLGLSQVFGVMKAHEGTVVLESEPGKGTCVILGFPPAQAAEAAAAVPADSGEPGRPLDIVLVDDDEMVRASVAGMLGLLGHRVRAFPGGLEALRRLKEGAVPDVVLLDLSMPEMDGEATLERLRLLHPGVPVILSTGYMDERAERILDRFPRVATLVKPFTALELKARLAQLG